MFSFALSLMFYLIVFCNDCSDVVLVVSLLVVLCWFSLCVCVAFMCLRLLFIVCVYLFIIVLFSLCYACFGVSCLTFAACCFVCRMRWLFVVFISLWKNFKSIKLSNLFCCLQVCSSLSDMEYFLCLWWFNIFLKSEIRWLAFWSITLWELC